MNIEVILNEAMKMVFIVENSELKYVAKTESLSDQRIHGNQDI